MKSTNFLNEYSKNSKFYNLCFASSIIPTFVITNDLWIIFSFIFIIFTFLIYNCSLTKKFIKSNKLSSFNIPLLLVHSLVVGFLYVAPILFLVFNSFNFNEIIEFFYFEKKPKIIFLKCLSIAFLTKIKNFYSLFKILFQLKRSKYFFHFK